MRRHVARAAESERVAREVRSKLEEGARLAISKGLIRRAWIIGSLAYGPFTAASDADLVVEGRRVDALVELEGLLLPLPVELDLLDLEELPPRFRDRVLAEGVELT